MKKSLMVGCMLLTLLVSGCCSGGGGLRGLLRGGACNSCQPGMGSPMSDSNTMSSCEDGNCGHDHGAIGTGADGFYGEGSSMPPGMASPGMGSPGATYGAPSSGGSLGSTIAPPASAPLPGPSGSGN